MPLVVTVDAVQITYDYNFKEIKNRECFTLKSSKYWNIVM